MLTFCKFGAHGRTGNQLFQYASLIGMANRHGTKIVLPRWELSRHLENPPEEADYIKVDMQVKENQYHYEPDLWSAHDEDFRTKSVDVLGWLQSPRFWEGHEAEVRRLLRFKKEFIDDSFVKLPTALFGKDVIGISIRRGDFVGNPNHYLLPIEYYVGALVKHFPDYRERNILIFSDDINYCKLHFQCLDNVFYVENFSAAEQLAIATVCGDWIISNSTFSWWLAYLSENKNTKVIRPVHVFCGELLRTHSTQDYWPDRWVPYDHKTERIDLSDVTFTIPVNFDSKERRENLDLCIKMLLQQFRTNIIVGEQGAIKRFAYTQDLCRYTHFSEMKPFHRTKMLNQMCLMATTPIVANWDADVLVPPMQIIEAAEQIRRNESDGVYPYDGRFARVPRRFYKHLNQFEDLGMLAGQNFDGMASHEPLSVGGAVIWSKESFIRGGMENEHMISYGPEDAERYDRFNMLEFKIRRIGGVLYHVDHIRGINSSVSHQHFNANESELQKIRLMTKDQLRNYVARWPWAQVYDAEYYGGIVEEGTRSRDVVLEVLRRFEIPMEWVVDFGCGLGQWGVDFHSKFGGHYIGIDSGVPQDKLVIPKEYYMEHDLRKPIVLPSSIQWTPEGKSDLGICAEVAEHLEEAHADQLIETLCRYCDHILFSAAIPGQGGRNHHNEQWPSYWAEKFKAHGYYPFHRDIRDYVWDDERVGLWYRQNMVLYSRKNYTNHQFGLNRVHPQMYLNLMRHHGIL